MALILLLGAGGFSSVLAARPDGDRQSLRIQSVGYQDSEQAILVSTQPGTRFAPEEIQSVRLSQPDRLIFDIPNAYLGTSARTIPIQRNGLNRIELSQTLGTFYQVVRLTIFADQPAVLANFKLQSRDNALRVYTGSSPVITQAASEPPLPNQSRPFSFLDGPAAINRNVVRSVTVENDQLLLSADPGQRLTVKNRFTLTGPRRLVIDLDNTTLADKSQTAPISVGSDVIRTVRLGQFEPDTVRVVVETPTPSRIRVVYPGSNRQTLALSGSSDQTVQTLPRDNQRIATVEDISLFRGEEGLGLKVTTSDPMVRRVRRHGDQIEIELMNVAAKPTIIHFNQQAYPEIKEIRLSALNAEQPNSKLIVTLEQSALEMDSHLSRDNRALTVTFSPRESEAANGIGARAPIVINPRSSTLASPKKGLFTVVVDAGHGGKDLGANREGVYEKDLNLSVALKLKQALEAKGVTVHMTRATDMFLPLPEICNITNRIQPDAFVSVHTNASVSTAANGIETYYYTPQSRTLAQLVHRRAVNSISSPDRGVRTAKFYVIHHTPVPAVLFEMGYISNPREREALQTAERQRATAEAIAQGVVEFLGRSYRAEAEPATSP